MRTRNADKEQLVKQKAMEMVVADGLEGFSVNKLAKECEISVATLYIYYKDKDDLITQIAIEAAERMNDVILKDFDPELPFEEGLRQQWKNRVKHTMENPIAWLFFEQLRGSSYHSKTTDKITESFKEVMGRFVQNAVKRGDINKMSKEVYWAVAFAPLYALLQFHNDGYSMGGKTFVLDNKSLWATFDLVIKALKA